MRRRDHNLLTNAVSLLICGLLAGVVIAAAAFPAVAMSGLAAKAGAETFEQLPSELKDSGQPQMSRVFANDNKTQIAVMFDEFRSDVPLKDIAPVMQQAIIAAEDNKFYEHNGVDMKGVVRAFVANKQGTAGKQGASTLTMQYVRMSIAYSATHPQDVVDATKDTASRKITEMNYAFQVEKQLSKEEILRRYLNIAPFGNGAYGVYAASQVYFSKKPKDLTIAEAAQLASLVKAPSAFNPETTKGYQTLLERRNNYTITKMVEIGAITEAQAKQARAAKMSRTVKKIGNGCVSVAKNNWGFFCDYFYRWWLNQKTFGPTTYDRERRLKSGGYRIVTTMEVNTQRVANENIQEHYSTSKSHPHALMEAAVQPGTGRVRALAVNRTFKLDDPNNSKNGFSTDPKKEAKNIRGTYPNTTNPLITGGGDITGYQGGSVFKLFTAVAALEQGYPLDYKIDAKPVYKSKYVAGYGSPSACDGSNKYCPKNAAPSMTGVQNMWSAFGKSVNTYFIPLEERAGADRVIDVAKRLGIQFRADNDQRQVNNNAAGFGSFTLGVTATTPLDLANSYATLAADGKFCEPTPVQEIKTLSGEKLDFVEPRCKQVVDVDVARAAVDAARCPVGDQSAFRQCNFKGTADPVRNVVGHPVFGKSGTTDGEKTAVLITGTKQLVVAGMLADPDWAETRHNMEHPIVNPATYETLADAMRGRPEVDFEAPTRKMAYGEQRSIPDVTCDSVDDAESELRDSGFKVETDFDRVNSTCPAGTVARTFPPDRTMKGGYVSLRISNGAPERPDPADPTKPGAQPDDNAPGNDAPDNNDDNGGRPRRFVLPGLVRPADSVNRPVAAVPRPRPCPPRPDRPPRPVPPSSPAPSGPWRHPQR